jgi:hypothetical protein
VGDGLRTVQATRYVTPLREGGSLPAIVEADDDGLYVLKFRGAGQGPKALIAELVGGELARALGLRVPELVFVELEAVLGRSEPDYEIQQLIKASAGLNLALDYLPGSLTYEPLAAPPVAPALASAIVWLDAYLTNVDRTAHNTNMLLWHGRLWLIDHGAALYFHHAWDGYLERALSPFPQIKDHVLLRFAAALAEAHEALSTSITPALLEEIIALIPDGWLDTEGPFRDADEHRAAYLAYLVRRHGAAALFVEEALRARAQLV